MIVPHPSPGPIACDSDLLALLAGCRLPTTDLSDGADRIFLGIADQGAPVAVVGLELCGRDALLRSLAVAQSYRRLGFGRMLVAHAELVARQKRIAALYLLTTTAKDFFIGLGYAEADRQTAPPAIRATSQFSGLCPSSSSFLSKPLVPPPPRSREPVGEKPGIQISYPCV